MSDDRTKESLRRLEGMMMRGQFDTAKAAIDRGAPVLREMGIDPALAKQAIETPPHQLESAGGVPPSALEAIVMSTNRPPLLVRNDEVQEKASLIGPFPAGTDARVAAVEHLLPSVGRIEFVNHDMAWGGTGWVIAEDGPGHFLVVTNRHVAKLVARRTVRGDGVFMFSPGNVPYGARIDFLEEVGGLQDPSRVLAIETFTYLADDAAADVALARVSRPSADTGLKVAPLPLADADGGDQEMVAVVGYPAADPFRNDPGDMQRYFKGLYDVKRFAPGYLRVQDGPTVLTHDCTTLGGNSGSPVISLESGKAVGLHFAGQYGIGNSAVRISTIKALLGAGASGDTHAAPKPPATDAADTEAADGKHGADHFEGRQGFDTQFLQVVPVPLPKIPDAIDLARPSDATDERPHELRYENFGILYSPSRKSPVIAALNIDGARIKIIKRTNKRWYKDLRIPAEAQLGIADYDDPDIDRGHMIRRAATNWGASAQIAKRANLDTYHYTVASPQHRGLNRNAGTWLGLETYILENARTHGFRANVFTGPIFGPSDPPFGESGVSIPLEYFKVVSMLAESGEEGGILRLHATAYVLSQGHLVQRLLARQGVVEIAEGFAFGDYRTFQVRIRDLEAETGYDFGPLRDADPLDRAVTEAAAAGTRQRSAFALETLDAIVL